MDGCDNTGRDTLARGVRGTPRRLEVLVRPDGLDVLEVDGDGARCAAPNPPRHPGDPACAGGGSPTPGDLLAEALSALGVRCRRRFSSPCG